MPYSHGRRRKSRTHKSTSSEHIEEVPKSMIVRHGRLTTLARQLVLDLRQVMEPWCVRRVREASSAKLKDYVSLATHMGLSHLQLISQTENGMYLKLIRLPSGITLTFKINNFTLMKDVRAYQRHPRTSPSDLTTSPLLVLNGFKKGSKDKQQGNTENNSKQLNNLSESYVENTTPDSKVFFSWSELSQSNQLISTFLSNMYPSIDVHRIKLNTCKRVVLYNYDEHKDTIELRHYAILKRPAGLTKGVKKLVFPSTSSSTSKSNQPSLNLNKVGDVSDFIISGEANLQSDSEVDETTVYDISSFKYKNSKEGGLTTSTDKIGISLIELGPRLTLEFIKAEEEVCSGTVIFHRYFKKSEEELIKLENIGPLLKKRRSKENKLHEKKMARKIKEIQNDNRKRKEEMKNKEQDITEKNDENEAISTSVMDGQDNIKDLPISKSKERYNPFSFKKKPKNFRDVKFNINKKYSGANSIKIKRPSIISKYHKSRQN